MGASGTVFFERTGECCFSSLTSDRKRGRHGFDMGRETFGACRGVEFLLNPATTVIVANDDNYALAA